MNKCRLRSLWQVPFQQQKKPEEIGKKDETGTLNLSKEFLEKADKLIIDGYNKRDELIEHLQTKDLYWAGGKYYKLVTEADKKEKTEYYETADILVNANGYINTLIDEVKSKQNFVINKSGLIYKIDSHFSGIIQLDFGRSYTRGEPVLEAITSKFEVSLWFGLIGYILSWVICVPLVVFKAIRHKTTFDSLTSILVFLGYAFS